MDEQFDNPARKRQHIQRQRCCFNASLREASPNSLASEAAASLIIVRLFLKICLFVLSTVRCLFSISDVPVDFVVCYILEEDTPASAEAPHPDQEQDKQQEQSSSTSHASDLVVVSEPGNSDGVEMETWPGHIVSLVQVLMLRNSRFTLGLAC